MRAAEFVTGLVCLALGVETATLFVLRQLTTAAIVWCWTLRPVVVLLDTLPIL